MEINTPYLHIRDDAEFAVRLNTVRPDRPFAIIDLSEDGRTGLTVESAEEIDRLIRAATEAKRLLAGAAADLDRAIAADLDEQTAPARPEDLDDADPGPDPEAATSAPVCGETHRGLTCTRRPGHDGNHTAHGRDDRPVGSWPQNEAGQ